MREVQMSLDQSVKQTLEDEIRRMSVGHYFQVRDAWIDGPGGGHIIFQGMKNHTADSIKSLESYDICYAEEAHTLSQRSLDILRPTFFRVDGGEMWFSWNPRKKTDPVDAMFRGGEPPPGSSIVETTYRDNPWFPDGLREEMEWDRRRDPEKYAHIWLGQYERLSDAAVFKNWRVDEFETPADVRFYYGADWGFANDPTVLTRCWLRGRTIFVDQEAYKIGCAIDSTPALFDTVPGSRRWPIVADSARPETIDYMRRHGFPKIKEAVKGPSSVEDGIEFLKSHDIVVHPRCVHTADEMAMYAYKVDQHTNEVLPAFEDKNNHVIDALRYALEGVRRTKPVAVSDNTLNWLRQMNGTRTR